MEGTLVAVKELQIFDSSSPSPARSNDIGISPLSPVLFPRPARVKDRLDICRSGEGIRGLKRDMNLAEFPTDVQMEEDIATESMRVVEGLGSLSFAFKFSVSLIRQAIQSFPR